MSAPDVVLAAQRAIAAVSDFAGAALAHERAEAAKAQALFQIALKAKDAEISIAKKAFEDEQASRLNFERATRSQIAHLDAEIGELRDLAAPVKK